MVYAAAILFVNAKMLLGEGSSAGTGWITPAIFTCLSALLFWFFRDKCAAFTETDKRVEGKIDKNFTYLIKEVKSIDGRVARIEGHLKLGSLASHSPLRLTSVGIEILEKSGIKDAADQFKDKLLEEIKIEQPATAYDVQEITKTVFQEFDFGEDNVRKFKDYAFQSGKWGLSDILDVGSIYFRDIVLKELGYKVEDLDKKADG